MSSAVLAGSLVLTFAGSTAASAIAHWPRNLSRRLGSAPLVTRNDPSPLGGREPHQDPTVRWQLPGDGRGTPAADGASVYFLSRTHEVVAVSAAAGAVRWRRRLPLDGTTDGSSVHRFGAVVVVGDTDVFGIDAARGRLLWRFRSTDGGRMGPFVGGAANGRVFVGSQGGRLYALDEQGRSAWVARVGDSSTTVFPPSTDGDVVTAGFVSDAAASKAGVIAVDARTGRERWRLDLGAGPFGGGPLLAGGEVVAARADGTLIGVSKANGSRRWSLPGGAIGGGRTTYDFRPLIRVGQTLVAGSLTGRVMAYDLQTRTKRWEFDGIEASVAFGLAADRNTVVVPFMSGHLVALDARTGAERWRTGGMRQPFSWVPLITDGRVYAAATGTGFFAFAE